MASLRSKSTHSLIDSSLPLLGRVDPVEGLEHPGDALLEIERAKVEPADPVLIEPAHHADGKVDTISLDRRVVVLSGVAR